MKPLFLVAVLTSYGYLANNVRADNQDRKPITDKCPAGYHTVQIEQSKSAEAKPGGIGGSVSRTEKYEVCRPIQSSNLKELPKKR